MLDNLLRKFGFAVCKIEDNKKESLLSGLSWPAFADSMIGLKRLDNIEFCVTETIKNNTAGDLIECGVWRGGATILMRALLKEHNTKDKKVWVADSFAGLPAPDPESFPADKADKHYLNTEIAVSLEQVKTNFEKYNLLDDQVVFLKGWFKDTLPKAPIQKLSVLRIDGDMYESTFQCLQYLYPKLSVGGYLIVDDWGAIPACKLAVEEYRKKHNISEEIKQIDWTGIYWKKEKSSETNT